MSKRLNRSHWTEAALAAMANDGTAGINVEQLAKALGTTKGSFYHHFENRQELLEAALDQWERLVTNDMEAATQLVSPQDQLLAASLAGTDTGFDGFVDLALASSLDQPVVAATVKRINAVRLDFLVSVLTSAGVPAKHVHTRATAGLASYLGVYQLQRMLGETWTTDQTHAHIQDTVTWMTRPA